MTLQNRWIAAIYFKNDILKYWRKSSSRVISAQEKNLIRSRIFALTTEANKQLNSQNAIATARIARIDFPGQWPTLFEDIAQLIQTASASNNLIQLSNLLNILKELVKSFSVTRFGAARTAFQAAASGIVQLIGNLYIAISQSWMSQKDNLSNHLALMEVGYLALKITGKVFAEGYQRVYQDPQAAKIFEKITQHFQGYVMVYNTFQSDIIAKHIKGLGKIFLNIFERQPVSFILLPSSMSVLQTYMSIMQEKAQVIQSIGNEDEEAVSEEVAEFWEKTVVQGLKLFSKLINYAYHNGSVSIRYRSVDDRDDTKAAHALLEKDLFNEQNIRGMLGLLLNNYLKLTPRDLESWKNEPEEWIAEEMKENWDYQARSCAQMVLVNMLKNFKAIVSPILIEFIQTTSSGNDILLQDVAYNVFALASSAPFENVSFDQMLNDVFLPRGYSQPKPNTSEGEYLKLVRRRIAIIISQWVCVTGQCSAQSRIKIYEFLLFCLNPEDPLNDIVIRLEACNALKFTIDEWDVSIDDFLPFLSTFLTRLFTFISTSLSSMESKEIVLQVISVIINRVEKKIVPFSELILQALPALWDESESHYQMRCVILQTLANFVQATCESSTQTYSISVPMLKVSVDPESPLNTFLFDDALPLWQALVESAPSPNDEILSLLPGLVQIIKQKTENLPIELKLLESYVFLSPESVANLSYELFKIFVDYIPSMNTESMTWVTTILNLLAAQLPLDAYVKPLYDTGLLNLLVTSLAAAISPITNVEILCFFSRMACNDVNTFVQMLDATQLPSLEVINELRQKNTSRSSFINLDDDDSAYAVPIHITRTVVNPDSHLTHTPKYTTVLGLVISQWISRFDNMGQPRDRKLNVLGTAAVLRTARPESWSVLADIFVIWQQLLDEATETDVGDAEIYYCYDDYMSTNEYLTRTSRGRDPAGPSGTGLTPEQQEEIRLVHENASPETKRRRRLLDSDPVHSIVLKNYLRESLFMFEKSTSSETLSTVDPGILQTLSMVLGLS